jgi:hypothetical protein
VRDDYLPDRGRPGRAMSCPERLAYWYLRLNGFLLLENFIVHPDDGPSQRTDADLLGVRFRNRAELPYDPMPDDLQVAACTTLCHIVIGEVKSGLCALNGPWRRETDRNINRVLSAIGCVPSKSVDGAATALYGTGGVRDDSVTVRLVAFGDRRANIEPDIPQVLFDEILGFIFRRFSAYRRPKADLGNWPADGRELHRVFRESRGDDEFRGRARALFNLPPAGAARAANGSGNV